MHEDENFPTRLASINPAKADLRLAAIVRSGDGRLSAWGKHSATVWTGARTSFAYSQPLANKIHQQMPPNPPVIKCTT